MISKPSSDSLYNLYGKDRNLTQLIKTQRDHPEFVSIYNGSNWTFYKQKSLSSHHLRIERIIHCVKAFFSKQYKRSIMESIQKLENSKTLYEGSQEEGITKEIIRLIQDKDKLASSLSLSEVELEDSKNKLKKLNDLKDGIKTKKDKCDQKLIDLKDKQQEIEIWSDTLSLLATDERALEELQSKKQINLNKSKENLALLNNFKLKNSETAVIDFDSPDTQWVSEETILKHQKLQKLFSDNLEKLDKEIIRYQFSLRTVLPDSLKMARAVDLLAWEKSSPEIIAKLEDNIQKLQDELSTTENSISDEKSNFDQITSDISDTKSSQDTNKDLIEVELKELKTFLPDSMDAIIKLVEEQEGPIESCKTLKRNIIYLAALELPTIKYTGEIGKELITQDIASLSFLNVE